MKQPHKWCLVVSVISVATLFGGGSIAHGNEPFLIDPDISWCWFQDDRMILDGERLLLGGVTSKGDIVVVSCDLQTKKTFRYILHDRLEADDHNAPALLVLPDGRYLAAYTKHGTDRRTRFRISERTGEITSWYPEQEFTHDAGVTYSNLCYLFREGLKGRIYNFVRSYQWDPNFIVSDDLGRSWRMGGRLLDGGGPSIRPYVRYKSNGRDTVHFIATEGHPNQRITSIYHGFIRQGKAYRSDGTLVNDDIFRREAPPVTAFTKVFQGDERNVAWTIDLELDSEEHPFVAFSVMKDPQPKSTGQRGLDHRYYYARWDGTQWHAHEMAHAGTRLYPDEPEYTGLAALHPRNPNLVFISTNADPVTGQPIMVNGTRRHEIFRGEISPGDKGWHWTAVTCNSDHDNLRPIVAADGSRTVLVWLRGEYRSYTDYNQAAMGLVYNETGR